jgi:hypothetical protein
VSRDHDGETVASTIWTLVSDRYSQTGGETGGETDDPAAELTRICEPNRWTVPPLREYEDHIEDADTGEVLFRRRVLPSVDRDTDVGTRHWPEYGATALTVASRAELISAIAEQMRGGATAADVAAMRGLAYDEEHCAVVIPGWVAYDGIGASSVYPSARDADDAARDYASAYEPCERTYWVRVYTYRTSVALLGFRACRYPQIDPRTHKIAIEPDVPACSSTDGHAWHSPLEIVGGCRENPGVFGSGGGVRVVEVCRHCGVLREYDTWATDRSDGTQGHTATRYVVPCHPGHHLSTWAEYDDEGEDR